MTRAGIDPALAISLGLLIGAQGQFLLGFALFRDPTWLMAGISIPFFLLLTAVTVVPDLRPMDRFARRLLSAAASCGALLGPTAMLLESGRLGLGFDPRLRSLGFSLAALTPLAAMTFLATAVRAACRNYRPNGRSWTAPVVAFWTLLLGAGAFALTAYALLLDPNPFASLLLYGLAGLMPSVVGGWLVLGWSLAVVAFRADAQAAWFGVTAEQAE
jgi:hypothetical protein